MTAEEMTNRALQHLDKHLRAYEASLNQTIADIESNYDQGYLDVTEAQWQDIIVLVGGIVQANTRMIHEASNSIYADGEVSGSLLKLIKLAKHFAALDFSETQLIKQVAKA
ncbi:hypothetical protein ETB91_11775 [Lacticaseibacillus rhamnosus]|uniref:Uncharacterized protein n=1 Tax=Lacticaseibacillus paracasei subsp. paracasei Lpp71 TaxID=1256207 RepID=A0A8E0ITI3_LACPA|nr:MULTISPECIES: hypothetical protein [Lacticaseibacillus]EKQ20681.1 hypothetical protein LCAUW4_1821 [Lacticaseibacillus casei UW4]EPC77138.1 hypothetical protein Lpp71_02411 [Lacticaseibacillus paracasei subsp. paracasei Lpp71]MCT3370197.1 hypothetical protein [Lacticaseibacillus paracasei]RNE07375.1 hypothetical protein FAM22279_01959 [Lacticaseibacillus paracasei]RXS53349.1 hypothetical protein ETB91_11775 [Lacticaseibacillus rhamnosus]